MRSRTRRSAAIPAMALAALVSAGASEPLPEVVPLDQTEMRIEVIQVGLLDQGCHYGNHTETLVVRATGEVQFRFQVLEEGCLVETIDFDLPREEFLRMLNELIATHFDRLDAEYRGRESYCYEGAPAASLSRALTITTHTGEFTITLKMGTYEQSVRYHHGAEVPGLNQWVAHWQHALEERAGFGRHLGE